MSIKKSKKSKKKNIIKNIKKKMKGFTLVELLAVIIILGVLLVLTIPAVLKTVESAQAKSFVEYMTKVKEAAEKEYLANDSLSNSGESCLLYNIETDLDLPPNNNFHGYVLVNKEGEDNVYYLTIWSDTYMALRVNYLDIDKEELKAFTSDDDYRLSKDYLTNEYCSDFYAVEDEDRITPTIIEKPQYTSFYNDSWKTINRKVKSGYVDYSVGDVKCIKIDGYTSSTTSIKDPETGKELKTCTEGEYLIRIVNTTPCTDTNMSETSCGFIVEFAEPIFKKGMEASESTKTIYKSTDLRNRLNNNFYKKIPSELKEVIASTLVLTEDPKNANDTNNVYDRLFLLNSKEILNYSDPNTDPSVNYTRQLDYYQSKGVTVDTNNEYVIKKYNNEDVSYWIRSASTKKGGNYLAINKTGKLDNTSKSNRYIGVAPAFKITNQSGK